MVCQLLLILQVLLQLPFFTLVAPKFGTAVPWCRPFSYGPGLSILANISVASDIFVNQLVYQCWLQYFVNLVTIKTTDTKEYVKHWALLICFPTKYV